MILPIDSKYRISADTNGWAIQRRKGSTWEATKWFGSLENTIKELSDLMLRTSDAKTLEDTLQEVKRISEILTQALTPNMAVARAAKAA